MTVTNSAQLRDRPAPPQGGARAQLLSAAVAAALALSGCSGLPGLAHRIEGGQIAKPRQPPPGGNQPYPTLASVPSQPAPPDQAELARVYQALVADRENARHLTAAPPDPSLPSASPELFGLGTAPPPPASQPSAQPTATATLAAAQGPAAEPAPEAAPSAAPSPPVPPQPARAAPAASAPSADVPSAPPPRAEPAPPAPPPAPAIPAPAPPAVPADAVRLAFEPGSPVLPAASAEALRALAKRRGGHAIAAIGYGDADSADPAVQAKALTLGLQRAQAIAQALAADGVPEQSVRLEAQAGGRGGSARIIE